MKKNYKFSLLLLISIFTTGCVSTNQKQPMSINSNYRLLDNFGTCDCNYKVVGDSLVKSSDFKVFEGMTNHDVFAADGITMIKKSISKNELTALSVNKGITGKIDEKNGTLSINTSIKNYSFNLPIKEYPDLFETGFVFGSLEFINAIETDNYVFALIQKPGTVIGFRFNKMTNKADKKFFHDTYAHNNALGQIFSILASASGRTTTDLVINGTLILDKTTDNIILGYSETFTTSSSAKFDMKPGSQFLKVYNDQGNQISDFSSTELKSYFHQMKLHGDYLIDLRSRVALHKNTGIQVKIENIDNIIGFTSKGFLYYDRATENYYFKKDS